MVKKIIQQVSPQYLRFRSFLLKARMTGRYKPATVSFPGYKLEVADMLSFAWQYWEIILKKCYEFKADNDKPLIIDCGGNIGLSAIYFSRLYPGATIKVIEADKTIAEICRKNLLTNKVNAELIDKAAWTKNGFIAFNADGADGGKISNSDSGNKVACIDFNEFLQQFSTIDFVKIDIEGAEATILNHARTQLKKIKNLFIEYHSSSTSQQQLGDILNLLRESGFRYYIEDLHKRPAPFMTFGGDDEFDLQLNIYATNTAF